MTTTLAPPDAGLLAWYDALDEDPPGHRLEVLEGVLIVTPSPDGPHQDRVRSLAEIIDWLRDRMREMRELRDRAERAEAELRRLRGEVD